MNALNGGPIANIELTDTPRALARSAHSGVRGRLHTGNQTMRSETTATNSGNTRPPFPVA
jgi:hypothetical protein